ncbi:Outer membrane efflux protein [Rubripirellula lacrimiformis]|uniref:Outer membrane efflux protein n=1 Tax=Rubripirellula lacrimiformis TaxID=1930273 RepID=A0A517NJI1_9BACT|nr:TolC family protein [Rubripirellula lacrimiformis]QDT07291.1 Outer membrane efflux protein [Rubripirellula lacrimiformis]
MRTFRSGKSNHLATTLTLVVMAIAGTPGCQIPRPSRLWQPKNQSSDWVDHSPADGRDDPAQFAADQASSIATVSHQETSVQRSPPTADEFDQLAAWHLSLDEAIQLALSGSSVIRDHGGRVLAYPDMVRTTLDPALLRSDPNLGIDASLSAFDSQIQSGFVWNGDGNSVNSAFSTGQFGVFSQPETLANLGIGRILHSGTEVSVGAIGGYDQTLAGGLYAAYGAEVRHPLMRGSGREINDIAGPMAKPGLYRGVRIAQIDHQQARLEVELAVSELVRDVSVVYWELFFAYQNLAAKKAAYENARQAWQLEKQRVDEMVSPPDAEALARQQFFSAEAAVRNAICGTAAGQTGVYNVELKLRTLMALPACDDRLIQPIGPPLRAPLRFNWQESDSLAQGNRIEVRKQQAVINKRILEIKAAKNFQRPQLDFIGQYRRLADDPTNDTELFGSALQGWQVGVDYSRPVMNRRENAAVRHAQLQLQRERAIAAEQRRQISAQLRTTFIDLDRAYGTMHSMQQSRDASLIRLTAQSQRHAEGEVPVEDVLEAQIRATKAETESQRSLVDYNLAFIKVHHARGTLLQAMGVGFSEPTIDECRFSLNSASVFSQRENLDNNVTGTRIASPSATQKSSTLR